MFSRVYRLLFFVTNVSFVIGMYTGLLVLFLIFYVMVAFYDQYQQGIESKVQTSNGIFLNSQDHKHHTIQVKN